MGVAVADDAETELGGGLDVAEPDGEVLSYVRGSVGQWCEERIRNPVVRAVDTEHLFYIRI
jgi:hypothetical protein